VQKTDNEPEKEQAILKKFVDDKVDLIFVWPVEAALEAKTAVQGTDIPILFANANLEGTDLVKSVREPGGNITGVRYPGPDLLVKELDLLHEILPQAKRVWVPYLKGSTVNVQLEAIRSEAVTFGITLVEVPIADVSELKSDVQARERASDLGVDAILRISTPLTTDSTTVISNFALAHKLPIIGALGNGGILSVLPDNVAVGQLAAPMADKILKGTAAGTIPVASADMTLRINYTTAQQLGVTIPEGILKQAAQIVR